MAKAKSIISMYYCKECHTPSKVTRRGKKPMPELKKFCVKCRKHTLHKAKDIKKPAKQ